MLPNQQARMPRIERTEEPRIQDDTGHLWAISYSDFLMVLLSFFILFFSVDPNKKDSVIQKVLLANGGTGGQLTQNMKSVRTVQTAQTVQRTPAAAPAKLPHFDAKMFLNLKVAMRERDESVLLIFPENIYPKGQVRLSKKEAMRLRLVFERLMPFKNLIDVTVIGHTDKTPVTKIRSRYMHDNNDLSSARANEALRLAARTGFPSDRLSAKAVAANDRNSRTISLLVSARTRVDL